MTALTLSHPNGAVFSNCVAEGTHYVGTLLTTPLSTALTFATRMIRPFAPGKGGQWSTSGGEVVRRILLAIAFLVSLGVGLCLSIVGAPLRSLASTARADFVHIHPRDQADTSRAPPLQQLTVTTYNVALMPEFIAVFNGLRPTAERVEELRLRLGGADIVCMQEAFHTEATQRLAQSTRDAYPYQVFDVGFQSLGLSSGLMIASAHPLENTQFYPHPVQVNTDRVGNKGVLATTVSLPGNEIAYVFNTHLNAHGSVACRRSQITALRTRIEEYTKGVEREDRRVAGIFICGDFNIGPASVDHEWDEHAQFFQRDYTEAPETAGGEKAFTEGSYFPDCDNVTRFDPTCVENWVVAPNRVDHILMSPVLATRSQFIRERAACSDHLKMTATVQLR